MREITWPYFANIVRMVIKILNLYLNIFTFKVLKYKAKFKFATKLRYFMIPN